MERSQLFDLMGELQLYGMKAAFDEIMTTAVKRQHEPQRIIGDLLTAEINEKQARSIKYQLTIANGKGLVPYIKGALYYDFLLSTLATQVARANPDPAPQDLPRTWDELVPGHLVIVRETLEFGWWEAIVIERTGDLVTVRYRDYPQYPPMVRHRSAIALISPPAQ